MTSSESSRKQTLTFLGRILLFCLGLALAAWLVRGAGLGRVLTVLDHAKGFVPVVIALEIGIVLTDVAAVRAMIGGTARRIPLALWVRSASVAYAAAILLPAGRAVGEAMRATTLAPAIGAGRAAAASSRLQACSLYANGIVSLFIALELLIVDGKGPLALATGLNALLCGTVASLFYALLKSKRFAAWLGRRFKRFVESHTVVSDEPPPKNAGARGTGFSLIGRAVQAVQYGVAVLAVGGPISAHLALTAQGIHLVGASVGDIVPNQMGVTEGAYRAFAHSLGFDAEPARALGIALLIRTAQIALAVSCIAVAAIAGRTKARPAGA